MSPPSPYSPDLAPCDYYLFHEAKKPLRGLRFEDNESIIEAFNSSLYKISDSNENLLHVFKDRVTRCRKCISSGGDYFEGM